MLVLNKELKGKRKTKELKINLQTKWQEKYLPNQSESFHMQSQEQRGEGKAKERKRSNMIPLPK